MLNVLIHLNFDGIEEYKKNIKEKYNKEILSIKEEMHKSEGRLMIRHILLLLGIGGLLIAITRLDKIIPLLKGMFGY